MYPRSFADNDGDGIGDLEGIIDHLDYIADLGFDAVWVSPFFASPQRDFGYDISDYCDVAPEYGTLADADRLIEEAHARGLRVIFDLVLNHTSDQHPWFLSSRASRTGPHADWYIWRDGRGRGGRRRPNNWRAALEVRSAWQWGPERQQWYLGKFMPFQPDLNWRNPEVKEAMFDVVRFWLRRGVDGFRLDMFGDIMKDPSFAGNRFRPSLDAGIPRLFTNEHTMNTADNFALAKELRAVCDEFGDRVLLGEVFGHPEVLRNYLGDGDGLQLVFLFGFLAYRYDAGFFRRRIENYERNFPEPFTPTYVFENHDRSRLLSRLGGDERKARSLAVMLLTLRGVAAVYNGQEIGMTNTHIPLKQAADPIVHHYFRWIPEFMSRRMQERLNRDEVRTPMQWDGSANGGFCPPGVKPWLPVNPDAWRRNVAAQKGDESSMLELYRKLLQLRRSVPALQSGPLALIDGLPDDVLGYRRGDDVEVYVSFAPEGRRLAVEAGEIAIASDDGVALDRSVLALPPHAAAVVTRTAIR